MGEKSKTGAPGRTHRVLPNRANHRIPNDIVPIFKVVFLLDKEVVQTDFLSDSEIFIKNTAKNSKEMIDRSDWEYYLDLEESIKFDKVVVRCTNWPYVKAVVVVTSIDKRGKEVGIYRSYDAFSRPGDFDCDITNGIIDGITQNNKNAGYNVPSRKKCTIMATVRVDVSDPTTDTCVCVNTGYTVWKKLVSRSQYKKYEQTNFGYEKDERHIAEDYFDLPKDSELTSGYHLCYYIFPTPGLNEISVKEGQPYYQILNEQLKSVGTINNSTSDIMVFNKLDNFGNAFSRVSNIMIYIYKEKNKTTFGPINLSSLMSLEQGQYSRFQRDEISDDKYQISAHFYGLAVDINSTNYFNENRNRWIDMTKIINKLKYIRCEERGVSKIYYFSYSGDTTNIQTNRNAFGIKDGFALVNGFLYHLAFKDFGFKWGGYFRYNYATDKIDAMHFSLVESEDRTDHGHVPDKYPKRLEDEEQYKVTYHNIENAAYNVYNNDGKLIDTPPKKNGKTFKCFTVNEDGSGTVYSAKSMLAFTGNIKSIVLYAQWK